MITFQSYNIYPKRILQPSFKGCRETTTLQHAGQNKDSMCIHETYFFRNIDTLNFVTDYLTKNYPKGTNIAEFASSTGEEAYSLAMLLQKNNQNKKYKIKGYDITPRIINQMDTRLYEITSEDIENFLDNDYFLRTSEQFNLKNLFRQNFEKIPRDWQCIDYSPRNIQKLKTRLENTKNEDEKRSINYMLSFSKIPPQDKWGSYFYPKKDVFKDVISFEIKDISGLGEKYSLHKNTGVIFFKNAFYHLIGMNSFKSKDTPDLELANKVSKEVNKSLDKNGIFVIGSLARDHLYNAYSNIRKIKHNNKEISVYDQTPFHQMLRNNGFEPIFYEQVKDTYVDNADGGLYLPSVWKKVKEI